MLTLSADNYILLMQVKPRPIKTDNLKACQNNSTWTGFWEIIQHDQMFCPPSEMPQRMRVKYSLIRLPIEEIIIALWKVSMLHHTF